MAINVNSISKRFGSTWALRNVSFDVPDGAIVGIFGGSGSGKSTLARILAGDLRSDGGDVRVASASDTQSTDGRKTVRLIGTDRPPKLADVVFKRHALPATGSGDVSTLASQLDRPYDLVVLDDPFRRTDAAQLDQAINKVRQYSTATNTPIIFLTSSFDQLIRLADTAHFLDKTEIMQSGTPDELYDDPTSTLLASLSGDVNLIEARRLTKSTAGVHEFHSVAGEHRIFAHAKHRSRLGPINQNITLAIRPEQVVMSLGASFPEDNLLKAVVVGIEPRGSTSLIHFDAEGLALSTRVFRVVGLNIGDECMLGLPPHRIVVLGA